MKTKFKHIVCAALSLALAAASVLPAFAAENPVKEEVVYVNLSRDGSVGSIYVVNSFDLPNGGTITDRGNYGEVKNLTTTDPILLNGGTVSVLAPAGKFYYEGALNSRYIPWDISVVYKLDGAVIDGEELAGKSGRLEINVSVRLRADANAVYRDNFAAQVSLALDGNRCRDVSAPGATMANAGDKKQMSYIILPGKDKDFTVTADVTNFEFDGISFNMIPLSLEIDTPDTSEFKGDLIKLSDGTVELDDGVGELVDGVVELDDGVKKLDDGATDLSDGVAELKDGVTELVDGVAELDDGAGELRDGVSDLYSGARELRNGAGDLAGGMAKFEDGVAAYGAMLGLTGTGAAGYAQYIQASLIPQLDATIAAITNALNPGGVGPVFAGAVPFAAAQGAEPSDPDDDAVEEEPEDQAAQDEGGGEDGATEEADAEPAAVDAAAADGLLFNVYAMATIDDTVLQGMLTQLSGYKYFLEHDLIPYLYGVNALAAGYSDIQNGASELTDGAEKLSKGTREFASGVRDLYDGVIDLADGTSELNDGVVELYDGVAELYDGTVELKDGTSELKDGTSELRDGTSELRDGTSELRDKTSNIDGEIDSRIDELLAEYRSSDFKQVSFVDAGNTNVRSVQFIMKTDGIKIPEAPAPAEETPEKLTIWQRFLNLFSFLKR